MKFCTFCSHQAQVIFNHPIHNIGSLCIDCYMKLHGSCGACGVSFIPIEIKQNVNYQVRAKFITMEEKTYLLCQDCFDAIQMDFPQQFA